MKETLADIAWAINEHTITEHQNMPCQGGVARYYVDLEEMPDIHQVFLANVKVRKQVWYGDDSINIWKNSKLGGALIMKGIGDSIYYGNRPQPYKMKVYNAATYRHWITGSIDQVQIQQEDRKRYRFADLKSLLSQFQEARRQAIENQKRLRELQLEREKIERQQKEAVKEEALRLQKEQEENERKTREFQEKAELLEKEIAETNAKIKFIKSFVRDSLELRIQHILDPSQEEAKRSHIYDDVPVLIDGGPGTGKTTTMIQRLKFLLSDEALRDYTKLSNKEIEELTDPTTVNSRWVFFSPNTLLLEYLRNNMREEELVANDGNTFTLEQFRKKMLLEYKLRNPETDAPFKNYSFRDDISQPLIFNAKQAINDFEHFCIENITSILLKAYSLPTADYEWHSTAVEIKAYCKRAENVKDMAALVNLFNSLQDNQNKHVKDIEQQLVKILGAVSVEVQQDILKDETASKAVKTLLEKWNKDMTSQNDEEILETEMTEDDDTEDESAKLNFEADLYRRLKILIRTVAINEIDSKKKLTGRQAELYAIVSDHIKVDSLKKVGSLAWFVKNYAALTKGIESNVFNQIPRLYKLYRKKQLETDSSNYDLKLLKKIIEKGGNKHLHADEQNLLIGFINNMLYRIYKRSSVRFNNLKHKYALAYKDWAKPVIGVDEATDYSILDYYLINSFRHYQFNSVTLSGDIMQGITEHGINDWKELSNWVLPELTKFELKVSYRQTPTLVNLAREMYKAEVGHYPSYNSDKEMDENNEPAPIACVSDDEDEKAEWIAKRIIEIYKAYDSKMPSVAIFVGDEVDVSKFINTIYDTDLLNGIDVVDCTGGRALNRSDIVRIFRINEVKGMEFEVAFFHNLDEALYGRTKGLMEKYLYVGVSRATTHLAATFCNFDDASNVLKYFETTDNNWKI
jgi:hypothetical protein